MLQYTADELLAVRRYDVTPPRSVRKAIFRHRLWQPARQRQCVQRHGIPWSRAGRSHLAHRDQLTAGFLNICSIANKLDALLDVRRDRSVDVLCLAETWHDVGGVAFNRLQAANYQIVDRPRPRSAESADLSTNHGGVAVIAAPGINLSPVNVAVDDPSTFEYVCARISTGQYSAIVFVIYRPGSSAVQPVFFDELSSALDVLATFQEAVYVVGDFNIRLERCDDPNTKQFVDLLSHYGFACQPTTTTHSAGGTIDAVITRCDANDTDRCVVGPLSVSVVDVGLSDHHLLTWTLPARRPPLQSQTVRCRPWRQLDVSQLCDELKTSTLCQPAKWSGDIDDMATMYEQELTSILDRLIPFREVTRRARPSDPWFDKDCLEAKRLTRRLERAYRATCRKADIEISAVAGTSTAVRVAKDAWYAQRRNYRDLCQRKRSAFWCDTVESDRKSPRSLWRSVNQLLGRGRPPASSAISVDEFSRFFMTKSTPSG